MSLRLSPVTDLIFANNFRDYFLYLREVVVLPYLSDSFRNPSVSVGLRFVYITDEGFLVKANNEGVTFILYSSLIIDIDAF